MDSKNFLIAGGTKVSEQHWAKLLSINKHSVYIVPEASPSIYFSELFFLKAIFYTANPTFQGFFPSVEWFYCQGSINLRSFKLLMPTDFVKGIPINIWVHSNKSFMED